MEERERFYFISLREGVFNGVTYHRLDFLDDSGNKYSASCTSDFYEVIAGMDIPKFAPISIEFSVTPSFGKMKISVTYVDLLN